MRAIASFICIMCSVFLPACSRNNSDSVVARQFTLVDGSGRITAQLVNAAGGAHLKLFDSHHRPRADLFLESNGAPDLYLFDSHGKGRLAVDLCDNGNGNVAYASGDGKEAVTTFLAFDGRYAISVVHFSGPSISSESAALQISSGNTKIVGTRLSLCGSRPASRSGS